MQNIPQIYDIAKTLYNKLINYTDKMYNYNKNIFLFA